MAIEQDKLPRQFTHPVRIGRGSFSAVWRVREQKLDRLVVLKIIPIKRKADAAGIEQEAHVLASMHLPCVPHVYDVIRFRKKVLIVMEWIRGAPLSVLLDGGVPDAVSRPLASNIIGALTILHESTVVHRDLKPENILVTSRGRIFFVDFGFSSTHEQDNGASGLIQGTPEFMAPELWSLTASVDYKKTDLFALGKVLGKLLGSALPAFAGDLIAQDPAARPRDCFEFEQRWKETFAGDDDQALRTHCGPPVEEYIARRLLSAARELYGQTRREEAYALLTESLEAWPDNPEALDFLQKYFSSPLRKRSTRRVALSLAIGVACIAACVAAYFLGIRSSPSRTLFEDFTAEEGAQSRRTMLLSVPQRKLQPVSPSITLRSGSAVMDIEGTVVIVVPGRKGTLFVDKMPIGPCSGLRAKTLLPAGTHRIEWTDSASQRTWGETIDLLPFQSKTVSFARFINGT
jgi:serine/threonine protein kinase